MRQILKVDVKETVVELRKLQRQHPGRFKPLQMLIFIRQQGSCSKYHLASVLGSSHSSVTKWRSSYRQEGIAGLLKENRGGFKPSAITQKAEKQLSHRLNNPKQGFRSFGEIQQWLFKEFKIEMNYHAINKHIKRKYGGRLKVSRKSHVLKSPADEAVFKKPV
jgi:transposase